MFWVTIGSVSAGLTVLIAAAGKHLAAGSTLIATASHYQFIHSLALVLLGALKLKNDRLIGWGFILGIILFSFSLYLYALTGMQFLVYVTPFGGIVFTLSWFTLAWKAFRMRA